MSGVRILRILRSYKMLLLLWSGRSEENHVQNQSDYTLATRSMSKSRYVLPKEGVTA
jgi:hypothetical protein